MDYEHVLTNNVDLIDHIVTSIARRRRLSAVDTDELRSATYLRLIDNDYALLRHFRGNSKLGTYLTVVIDRICIDFCAQRSGRRRPTAVARRLGPVAIALERMVFRDGFTFNEAAETLKACDVVSGTRTELYELLWRLWPGQLRRHQSYSLCDTEGWGNAETFTSREGEEGLERIRSTLLQVVGSLSERNRTLLDLRFGRDLPISAIAALLHENNSVVRRQLQRLVTELKRQLRDADITASDVNQIVGHASLVLDGIIGRTA